jgi:cell division ATPase FtsA
MPRKQQTLTIEQLNEIIESRLSEETFHALQSWAKGELNRRRYAGNTGGRPVTVEDKKAANREYQKRWRERNKLKNK